MKTCLAVLLAGAMATAAVGSAAAAPAVSVHKTTLQDAPFPDQRWHTVTIKAVIDPGGRVDPHTHPGLEMAYVVQGTALLQAQGVPDRSISAGGAFAMPEGDVHSVRNIGQGPLIIVSTYVVDKAKPVVIPEPQAR